MKKLEHQETLNDYPITLARAEDVPGILDVQEKTWLATYVNKEQGITAEDILGKNFKSTERIEKWRKKILDQDLFNIAVAKNPDGRVVAFCMAKKEDPENKIAAIYILPEYQARGLGRKLMKQALDWLGNQKPVYLNVVTFNSSAIKFYEKLGFQVDRDAPPTYSSAFPSGKTMPEIKMIKK